MKNTDKTPGAPTVALSEITAVEELLRAGRQLAGAQTPDGLTPFVLVPEGYRIETLDPEAIKPLPDHIAQEVRLDDADSFVAYVKLFRTATTRIFATAPSIESLIKGGSGAKFSAVLDYHESGKEQTPKRAAHVAEYPCPLSLEIRAWLAANRKPQSQMDFVQFIEDNRLDVVSPDSATLMELALNFEAKTAVEFASKVDRVTGGRSLQFKETVDATGGQNGGSMKVPESLKLRVPIFEGGKVYELTALLEYRVSNGKLTIGYRLQQPQVAFRQALIDLRADIEGSTEIEVLTGSADI